MTKLSKKDQQLVALAKLLLKKRAQLILVDEPEKVFSECGVSFAMNKLRSHSLQERNASFLQHKPRNRSNLRMSYGDLMEEVTLHQRTSRTVA